MSISDAYRAAADVLEDLEDRGVDVRAVTPASETASADADALDVTLSVRIPASATRTETAGDGGTELDYEALDARLFEFDEDDVEADGTEATVPDGGTAGTSVTDGGAESVEAASSETGGDEGDADRVECPHEGCTSAFDSEHGMKIHRSKVHGGSADDEPPAYADPAALREVYDRYDTFAGMTDALEVSVTPKTVRHHMIEHGIHEADAAGVGGDAGATRASTDGTGEESASDRLETEAETDELETDDRTVGDETETRADELESDPRSENEESVADSDEATTETTETAAETRTNGATSVAAAAPRESVRPVADAPATGASAAAVPATGEDSASDAPAPDGDAAADTPGLEAGATAPDRASETDGIGDDDGGEGPDGEDVDGERSDDGEDPEPSDDYAVPGDVDLPSNVSVADVVDAVGSATTVFEVGRDLRLSRERARKLLRDLDLLDLVTGRLSSHGDRDELRAEIDERLRAQGDEESAV